jgi:hypothetical protein
MACKRRITSCPTCRKSVSRKSITVFQLIGAHNPSINITDEEDEEEESIQDLTAAATLEWLNKQMKDCPRFSRNFNYSFKVLLEEVCDALNDHFIDSYVIRILSAMHVRMEDREMGLKLDLMFEMNAWTIYGESPHVRPLHIRRNLIRTRRAIAWYLDPFRTSDPSWPYEDSPFRYETIQIFIANANAYWRAHLF